MSRYTGWYLLTYRDLLSMVRLKSIDRYTLYAISTCSLLLYVILFTDLVQSGRIPFISWPFLFANWKRGTPWLERFIMQMYVSLPLITVCTSFFNKVVWYSTIEKELYAKSTTEYSKRALTVRYPDFWSWILILRSPQWSSFAVKSLNEPSVLLPKTFFLQQNYSPWKKKSVRAILKIFCAYIKQTFLWVKIV